MRPFGYGERKAAILYALSSGDVMITRAIVAATDELAPGDGAYAVASAATRRALAGMQRAGLVSAAQRSAHAQGRPTGWQITQAGRDFLSAREN